MGEFFKVYSDFEGWEKLAITPTLEKAYLVIKEDNLIDESNYLIIKHDTDKNMDCDTLLITKLDDLLELKEKVENADEKPKILCKRKNKKY